MKNVSSDRIAVRIISGLKSRLLHSFKTNNLPYRKNRILAPEDIKFLEEQLEKFKRAIEREEWEYYQNRGTSFLG